MRERPLQQAVVLAREHSDINGEVRSFAAAVPVRKDGHLETVSVTMRVESRAEELCSASGAISGFLEVTAIVGDFPKQSAVLGSGKFLDATPQLPQLESLPRNEAAE